MASIGIGRGAGALADVAHVERRRYALRELEAGAQPLRQLHDADRAIRAGDDEATVGEFDVGGGGFQHVRGDLFALLDQLGRGFDDGGAAVHDRFRTAGAAARQKLVAVALQETDALERDAEPLAQHLRERRRVSLPVVERAGDDGDGAVGLETEAAHFLARRRGDLEIVADAEPAYFSTFAALAFAAGEALDIGRLQRVLEHAGKVAAVVV